MGDKRDTSAVDSDVTRRLVELCREDRSPRCALVGSLERCAAGKRSTSPIDLSITELRKSPELPSIVGTVYGRLNRDLKRPPRGVVFTPTWLAAEVAKRLRPGLPVVDLGAGTGALSLAAARRGFRVTAIEQDPNLASILGSLAKLAGLRDRIEVIVADALEYSRRGDAQIVSNPPFTRHHSIPKWKKAELAAFATSLETPLRLTSGYYSYFLAYAWSSTWSLRDVFVLPTNWLETRYGEALREKLARRTYELLLIENGHHEPIFDRAMTTVCLLTSWPKGSDTLRSRSYTGVLETRSGPATQQPVQIVGMQLDRSASIGQGFGETPFGAYRSSAIDPTITAIHTLGELFKVKRGVATGSNSFFVLSRKHARELGIGRPELVKVLRSMRQGSGAIAYLWSPARSPSKASVRRVREGVRLEVSKGYICSHRTPWWRVGHNEPPDYFLSYMGRGPARITLNRGKLLNLNNLHGLYVRDGVASEFANSVIAWLSTPEGAIAISRCVRHFYGGMWKLEPRDAERIQVPNRLFAGRDYHIPAPGPRLRAEKGRV